MTTLVYFKKFNDGDVIALFPELVDGQYITSYMHIGQHSGASDSLVYDLEDAKKHEYSDLYNELLSIGYDDMRVIKNMVKQ